MKVEGETRGMAGVSTMFYILYMETTKCMSGACRWAGMEKSEADSVPDSWIRLYNSASFLELVHLL